MDIRGLAESRLSPFLSLRTAANILVFSIQDIFLSCREQNEMSHKKQKNKGAKNLSDLKDCLSYKSKSEKLLIIDYNQNWSFKM
jgi:hypothetical protein